MKIILTAVLAALVISAQAQSFPINKGSSLGQSAPGPTLTNFHTSNYTLPIIPAARKSVLNTATIGQTNYDRQSDGCISNRIAYNPNTGAISAVWTGSTGSDPFPDRGTFYNFYDGSNWGANPTSRIENLRTGWPVVVHTSVSELVVSHDFPTNRLISSIRATPGSGSWTQGVIPGDISLNPLYPQMAVGGTSNKTVHLLGFTSTPHAGFSKALLYWRSEDGGYTWVVKDSILPPLDTNTQAQFHFDRYTIDAKDSIVAIGIFNIFDDSYLLKSTDNGKTWTKTIFWSTGLTDYDYTAAGTISDVNNDAIVDTIESPDGSGAVLIDNNGLVHVFFGRQKYYDEDLIALDRWYYFPRANGLYYWNENSTNAQIITGALDLDKNGKLNIQYNSQVGIYYRSLSSYPNAGIDANNNLFFIYSAINELESTGTQFFNKIYMMSSRDAGNTWSSPREITSSYSELECVFGNMARTVDDKIRLTFQLDGEPGMSALGDLDPPGQNDIVYMEVDTNGSIGVNEYLTNTRKDIELYPNPAESQVTIKAQMEKPGNYLVKISCISGKHVEEIPFTNIPSGSVSLPINTSNLAPGVYFINLAGEGLNEIRRLVIQ